MMRLIIFSLIIGLIFRSNNYSQDYDKIYKNGLMEIYDNFIYKTDDLQKSEWRIDDLRLTSEIFQNLLSNNEVQIKNGNHGWDIINSKQRLDLWKDIHIGRLRVFCRQRQYGKPTGKEIEYVYFKVDDTLRYKPLDGWWYIKEALTEDTYKTIKGKKYPYTDITDRNYTTSSNNYYFILNPLHSELILNSIILDTIGAFSSSYKFFSLYYHLGEDNINLPSWYKGSINAGLKLRIIPYYVRNNLNYERFSIALGWDGPINFSIQNNTLPGFMEDMFGKRLLNSTSDNIFIGIAFSPSPEDPIPFCWLARNREDKEFVQLSTEASFPLFEDDNGLSRNNLNNFYSVRGYFSFTGTLCNISSFFNIGASFSYFQLYNYSYMPDMNDPSILGSKKHYLFAIEPAISRDDPPISYFISPQVNVDVTNGQKFFVFKSNLMLYNSFGVQFEYFEYLNKRNIVPWHYNNYIVISPIIRINY